MSHTEPPDARPRNPPPRCPVTRSRPTGDRPRTPAPIGDAAVRLVLAPRRLQESRRD